MELSQLPLSALVSFCFGPWCNIESYGHEIEACHRVLLDESRISLDFLAGASEVIGIWKIGTSKLPWMCMIFCFAVFSSVAVA